MFVLDRFLFKPMFAFMDKRSERIENAVKKKAEYDRAAAEAEILRSKLAEENEQKTASLIKISMAKARSDADKILADAHKKQNADLESRIVQLDSESKKIEELMDKSVDELAKVFADALVSRE